MEKRRKKQIGIWAGILLGISALVMYVTHRYVPFMMDDLWYSTILSDETVPISSLGDIIRSQIWHYQNWGGRSITHGILQITLLAGEQAADWLNLGATFLLAWVVCLVSGNRRLPIFFAAVAMMLGLNANWEMSMFWQAGAANYLYITSVILFFAFCYLRELSQDEKKRLRGITFWMIPLGLLAGWSNENMGPTVWILSLLVILLERREKRKVSAWMILGNLSCLAGSIAVIIAPGNFVRSQQAPDREYGLLWRLFLRGYAESRAALEYLFPTLMTLGIVMLVGKCVLKIPVGKKNLLLLFCAFLSWGAMFLSPHYPDRATFGTMMLLICVILSMAGEIVRKREDMLLPLWSVLLFIWLRGMYFCGVFLAVCWGWIR